MMRYNTDTSQFEFYANGWSNAATAASLASSYLPLTGGTLSGRVLLPTGNATAPALSFSGNTGVGIFYTTNAVTLTAGVSNSLVVQSNVVAPTFIFSSVDGLTVPNGATTDRPTVLSPGTVRWNTTLAGWDFYDGTNWDTHRYSSLTGSDSVASEQMHFIYDTTRSKFLSDTVQFINFQSLSMGTDDFIWPGATLFSADVGTMMPYPGTVTGITAYASNVNKTFRSFSVYIESTENTNQLSFGNAASVAAQASATNLNIDFNAGQKILLRTRLVSGTTGNKWTNLNLVLFYKWRN